MWKYVCLALVVAMTACAEVETQRGWNALWADQVAEKLDDFGVGILQPYDRGDAPPTWFWMRPGWDEISMPSVQTIEGMEAVPLPPPPIPSTCTCPNIGEPRKTHECTCAGDGECWDSVPCSIMPMGVCQMIVPCADDGNVCITEPMQMPDLCSDPISHNGKWCGRSCSLLGFLDCCGPCGCDLLGCSYACDNSQCPANDHPTFPYSWAP